MPRRRVGTPCCTHVYICVCEAENADGPSGAHMPTPRKWEAPRKQVGNNVKEHQSVERTCENKNRTTISRYILAHGVISGDKTLCSAPLESPYRHHRTHIGLLQSRCHAYWQRKQKCPLGNPGNLSFLLHRLYQRGSPNL